MIDAASTTYGMHGWFNRGESDKEMMKRIVFVVLCVAMIGCDDSKSPTAPTAIVEPTLSEQEVEKPATTTATITQSRAGLSSDAVRAANPDKRTVDFSGVNWEWNAKRTHLEPDRFPDARVDARSNVWRRGNGTGLIRIFSTADLSGWSFNTAAGSWSLRQRRPGLFVSNISAEDVEQIRVGGDGGGRAEQTPTRCWPRQTLEETFEVDAISPAFTVIVDVTCDRNINRPGDDNAINAAATPTERPTWIPVGPIRFDYPDINPTNRQIEIKVTIYPDDNAAPRPERTGTVSWAGSNPPGEVGISLNTVTVRQRAQRSPMDGE